MADDGSALEMRRVLNKCLKGLIPLLSANFIIKSNMKKILGFTTEEVKYCPVCHGPTTMHKPWCWNW